MSDAEMYIKAQIILVINMHVHKLAQGSTESKYIAPKQIAYIPSCSLSPSSSFFFFFALPVAYGNSWVRDRRDQICATVVATLDP